MAAREGIRRHRRSIRAAFARPCVGRRLMVLPRRRAAFRLTSSRHRAVLPQPRSAGGAKLPDAKGWALHSCARALRRPRATDPTTTRRRGPAPRLQPRHSAHRHDGERLMSVLVAESEEQRSHGSIDRTTCPRKKGGCSSLEPRTGIPDGGHAHPISIVIRRRRRDSGILTPSRVATIGVPDVSRARVHGGVEVNAGVRASRGAEGDTIEAARQRVARTTFRAAIACDGRVARSTRPAFEQEVHVRISHRATAKEGRRTRVTRWCCSPQRRRRSPDSVRGPRLNISFRRSSASSVDAPGLSRAACSTGHPRRARALSHCPESWLRSSGHRHRRSMQKRLACGARRQRVSR